MSYVWFNAPTENWWHLHVSVSQNIYSIQQRVGLITATSLMAWRKIGVSGTSIDVGPYNSPDELLFICRAFLTLRACSLILLACLSSAEFESHWFSFNESPLDGCLVGDDFLADPSNSEKPLTGVLPQEKKNFTHGNENKNVIVKPQHDFLARSREQVTFSLRIIIEPAVFVPKIVAK